MATCAGEVLGEFSMTCTYASKPISQCFLSVSVPEPCLGQSCTQAGGTGLLGGVWCNHKQVLAENRCRCTCAVAEPSGGMIRTGPISDHAAGQAALVVPDGDLVPVVLARLLFGMGQPLFTSCLGYRSALGALSASAL